MRDQEQFLKVLDRDEAERRFRAAVNPAPRGVEHIPVDQALGRVLASDVVSPVDVPSFDRSNVDGFAVVSDDTFGASEEVPRAIRLSDETIHTGMVPGSSVSRGVAVAIATGWMMPRGADAERARPRSIRRSAWSRVRPARSRRRDRRHRPADGHAPAPRPARRSARRAVRTGGSTRSRDARRRPASCAPRRHRRVTWCTG